MPCTAPSLLFPPRLLVSLCSLSYTCHFINSFFFSAISDIASYDLPVTRDSLKLQHSNTYPPSSPSVPHLIYLALFSLYSNVISCFSDRCISLLYIFTYSALHKHTYIIVHPKSNIFTVLPSYHLFSHIILHQLFLFLLFF